MERVYLLATLLTFTFVVSSAYNNNPHWVNFNPTTDKVPEDAIIGGHEDGTLYIIRAKHKDSMTPGKFVASTRQAYIPWGGHSYPKSDLEILCGRNYEWVSASMGSVPTKAVIGGYSEINNHETLYIGRVSHAGHIIPGKIHRTYHKLFIAYGNEEIEKYYYDVLVLTEKMKPKITGDAAKEVIIGSSVKIECRVLKGVPEPTITWQFKSKDNTKFESLPGSDSVLRISNVAVKNTGSYKCIAHNEVGTDEHVTEVSVQKFAPSIISEHNLKLYGVEGDVALRIPCDVVGVPEPIITWKTDGAVITPNAHYSIIDGALIIQHPKQSDSKSYTCEANNRLGLVNATFNATIDTFLEDYGTVHEENVSKGSSVRLKCGSGDPSQSIRWFVEGVDTGVKGQYYDLANIDVTFDGNYTCRVSDMNGGHTETYQVIVGSPPKFYYGQDAPQFDWSGNERDDLDCDVEAKPPAEFKWMFNGEVINNQTSSRLAVDGNWGHYTCNVSNIHGSVQRHFEVISSQCLIPRKPKNIDTMPLILSSAFNWPVLDSTTDYLTVPPEDTVIFSCPTFGDKINSLQNFTGQNEIIATCVKQDLFKVQDALYKVSDLQCAQQVHSVVINKREKCLTESSELMRVGHEVHGFLETYEVCLDVSHNIPLYTRAVMSKSNRGVGHTYSWHEHPGLAVHSGHTAYTCTHSTSSCCYTNTQLLNAKDVSDGPPQKTTFIRPLNAVPYWRPCDTNMSQSPWHTIENLVRSRIDSYDQFVVWSGTHLLQNINGTVAPRYLWKVIRFADDDSLAMVYVNGPSPSNADVLCRNICAGDSDEGVQWIREHNQHTYCCDVDEFLQAFNLRGTTVGEQLDFALNKILSRN